MMLSEIRGGVMLRLGPREKVTALLAAVDIEIHNAIDDVRSQAKLLGAETLDRVAYIDAQANQDIYPWPEEADEIRDVFTLGAGVTPIPMTQAGFREQHIVDWAGWPWSTSPFAWTQYPGRRFRVLQRPLQDEPNAFMVRFFPGHKRMVKATDEPNLPRAVHENLIPLATMRMASYDGIGLSHPVSFDLYRRHMAERLELFLQPDSTSGSANQIQDLDPYYIGGA